MGDMTLNTCPQGTCVHKTVPSQKRSVQMCTSQILGSLCISLKQMPLMIYINTRSSMYHLHFHCWLGTRNTWGSKSAWMAKRTCRDSVYNQMITGAMPFSHITEKRFIRRLFGKILFIMQKSEGPIREKMLETFDSRKVKLHIRIALNFRSI